jgi:hypothetical protein
VPNTHKAISAAVHGSNFGKSIISKYLRVIYDFCFLIFWPILKIFFIPRSPRTTPVHLNFLKPQKRPKFGILD